MENLKKKTHIFDKQIMQNQVVINKIDFISFNLNEKIYIQSKSIEFVSINDKNLLNTYIVFMGCWPTILNRTNVKN